MKSTIRTALSRLVVGSGATALLRRLSVKQGAVILMGHRVSADEEGLLPGLAPEWFEEQVAYLSRHYQLVTLGTLVDWFERNDPVPPQTAVLTFDDGFRDNHDHAWPILKKYDVPATIFLVTGSITSGQLPWPQQVGYAVQHTRRPGIRHELLGEVEEPLDTGSDRWDVFGKLYRAVGRQPRVVREETVKQLGELLEVELPTDRMLTWEQCRAMRATGIELGAHTESHPMLAEVPKEEVEAELSSCRETLRAELGVERPTFAFPGGSYDASLVEAVRAAGFRSAFQSDHRVRVNSRRTVDAFSLSRVGLPNAPGYMLEAELDGIFHPIRKLYRR